MRTNYILVDFENVQPASLMALVSEPSFKALVFVGASQTKIPFEFAASMQALGDNASYVKISGNGSNALDFHVAYYIGRLAAGDPTAYFHIISRDTGFDPPITHLKAQKILAARSKDILEIGALKAANSKTLPEKLDVVVGNLRQRGASRPRTVKTLSSTVGSLFQKQLAESDIKALLTALIDKGFVSVDGTRVTYTL